MSNFAFEPEDEAPETGRCADRSENVRLFRANFHQALRERKRRDSRSSAQAATGAWQEPI